MGGVQRDSPLGEGAAGAIRGLATLCGSGAACERVWEGMGVEEGRWEGGRIRLAGVGGRAFCSGNSRSKGIEAGQSSWGGRGGLQG